MTSSMPNNVTNVKDSDVYRNHKEEVSMEELPVTQLPIKIMMPEVSMNQDSTLMLYNSMDN